MAYDPDYHRAYYIANKERIREKGKRWREANRERVQAAGRSYADKNRDKLRAYWREYYKNNKDKVGSRTSAYHKRYYLANKPQFQENNKKRHLLTKYGLTVDQWQEMFDRQNRCCAACLSDSPQHRSGWQTDHCHQSGAVRGILCAPCNATIGHAKECSDRLERLAKYIRFHHSEVGRSRR